MAVHEIMPQCEKTRRPKGVSRDTPTESQLGWDAVIKRNLELVNEQMTPPEVVASLRGTVLTCDMVMRQWNTLKAKRVAELTAPQSNTGRDDKDTDTEKVEVALARQVDTIMEEEEAPDADRRRMPSRTTAWNEKSRPAFVQGRWKG
eukprot:jgi/Mesvir1/14176/Mv09636-RA.1